MAANTSPPLLADRDLFYTMGEREDREREESGVSTAESQLTALAEELGLKADALSGASTERGKGTASSRRRNGHSDPVVTIAQEQLDELQAALENTIDLIRQVGMNSVELEALRVRRR